MTNILEAAVDVAKSLTDDKKQPLHIGEAMLCWTHLTVVSEANDYIKIGINTTTDEELNHALKKCYDICDSHAERLKTFMIREGVQLPQLSETRPDSDPEAIPDGVKQTDYEIANGLSIKVASAIVQCATGVAESIRTDVGLMWTEFVQDYIIFGAPLKEMMSRRGWLKQPPFYHPPGLPRE
jgi:hypothetical protein